jgi:putative DNA primase/helicase
MKRPDANDVLREEGSDRLRQQFDAAFKRTSDQAEFSAQPEVIDDQTEQGSFLLVRKAIGGRKAGVYFNEAEGAGEGEAKPEPKWCWVCSQLEPLAKTRGGDNRNWGRLLEIVDADGVRHTWPMAAKIGPTVGDGVDFRRELVDRGLEIASGNKARNRLNDYVTTWKPTRTVRCVASVGWCGGAFVLPDKTYGGDEEVVLQIEGVAPEFTLTGNLSGWRQDIASKCVGNSRLIFGVSAAFAGPLLKLAGEESGGFHFRGPSSMGKTTVLHSARSVWGTPLGSWRTTDNNAEAIAAGACDALLTLDEIGQASPRVVGELAYMLGNGRGKGRMKRDATVRPVHRWRMLFLSTGEIAMATRLTEGGDKVRAGQEVRVLEIAAAVDGGHGVFENLHGFSDGAQLAEHLRHAADLHGGYAAEEFLTHATKNLTTLASDITAARSEFIAQHCPTHADGQVRRACGRFAVVGIAGELATQYGVTGWRQGEANAAAVRLFLDWLDGRGGAGAAETREALSLVRAFLEQHGEARFAPAWDRVTTLLHPHGETMETSSTDRPTNNRAGFRRMTNEGTIFYVLPEVWRREVCKGLDAKVVAAAMVLRGWIIPGDGRNIMQKPRIPGHGSLRVYVIPPAFLSQLESEGRD